MGHPPIEKLLPRAGGSIYKLSRLAAKRAAELASGRKPLVACDSKTKTATIALEEILAGAVVMKQCAEQMKSQDAVEEKKESSEDIEE